jgi:hypothetical protein
VAGRHEYIRQTRNSSRTIEALAIREVFTRARPHLGGDGEGVEFAVGLIILNYLVNFLHCFVA